MQATCRSELDRLWGLPWYFSLREEARKGWEHRLIDKFIHVDEVFISKYNAFTRIVDFKLNFDIWIEMHLFFEGERKAHYCLIADLLSTEWNAFHLFDSAEIELPSIGNFPEPSEVPVLVDIPELIQSPEMGRFVVVPSVVRLHRLHQGECRFGDAESNLCQSNLCINRVLLKNRERQLARWLRSSQESQLPCEVIQRCPETRHEISGGQDKLEESGRGSVLNLDDVLPLLDIVISSNSIITRISESSHLLSQIIEVFLRPLNLKSCVPQAMNHAL